MLSHFYSSVFIALFVFLYCLFSGHYNSLNPDKWGKSEAFFFASFLFAFGIPILAFYIGEQKKAGSSILESVIDFNEYNDKKYLDAIFSHYTNVATAGLFCTMLVYLGREYNDFFESGLYGIFLACIYVLVIFVYCIFSFKLIFYFRPKFLIRDGIVLFLITLLDTQIMYMFIQSAPKTA